MKKITIVATAALLFNASIFASEDANCTSKLNKVSYDVKVSAENEGVSSQQLFDQAEVVKKVKPFLIKEIKKYTKMLSASDEAYSGVTTVDRIINEVCELKTPLWNAMSANQKTLMIGIDGTSNPYIRKSLYNVDVKTLQSQLDATKSKLSKTKNDLVVTKMQLTKAYKSADQAVIKAANDEIARHDAKNAEKVKALEEKIASQGDTLTTLTASPHSVGVYNTAKFHGFKTIDFKNGETGICSSGVRLKAAEQVDLYAICIVDAGQYGGVPNLTVYEGYSTDSSDSIDFVRLPYTIKSYNMPERLRYYNASKAIQKGLRNGPDYQSAELYSGGKVITSDSQEYSNSYVAKKTTKKLVKVEKAEPLHVLIVNTEKKPVVQESTSWWH